METRPGAGADTGVTKKPLRRSSNACTRCRKQKIKCSGMQPCEGCSKRKVACNFDDNDNKVVVSRAYLLDLQRRLSRAEQRSAANDDDARPSVHDATAGTERRFSVTSFSAHEDDGTVGDAASYNGDSCEERGANQPTLTNPLADSPSTFVAASNGNTFYQGTSSNWSFAGKILQLTHSHLHQAPLPPNTLLFDGLAYNLGWNGTLDPPDPEPFAIPSQDYSIHLINAVKFHCGQMFHLFDDQDFHKYLQLFYSDPEHSVASMGLWYIHFLLILAFGKSFTMQRPTGQRPPGVDYFVRAMQLLPSGLTLCLHPVNATEVLCCVALYLHSIDHRHAAHTYIGQALRTALCHGMHTDMPVQHLGEDHVQRCRKIWWTVYILDRQMTSIMGLPQSVQDSNVHCQLPVFPKSPQRTATLEMHIKLARVIAEINDSIYGVNGRLNKKFLISTKASLENIAGMANELRQALPLKLNQPGIGVSRMSASMHLLYHQCIVLATRPLMFCCLKMKLESVTDPTISTHDRISTLLQMCMESAQQIINILENLQLQGLIETFLSMDLDALYVASIILLVGSVVDKHLLQDRARWVQKTLSLLENIEISGNLVATWRKSEIQQLEKMLGEILDGVKSPLSSGAMFQSPNIPDLITLHPLNMANLGNGEDLLADQIMAIANSIQEEDAEWMDRAVMENSIW